MSGRRYEVVMAPSAQRRYKKFEFDLQTRVKEEVTKVSQDPFSAGELKGPLRGIRSHHFEHKGAAYRIAYRVVKGASRIEVILVDQRGGFYEILRRIAS